MTEAQFIIERMSPPEMAMLRDRGAHLPGRLIARIEQHEADRRALAEIECHPPQEARRAMSDYVPAPSRRRHAGKMQVQARPCNRAACGPKDGAQ